MLSPQRETCSSQRLVCLPFLRRSRTLNRTFKGTRKYHALNIEMAVARTEHVQEGTAITLRTYARAFVLALLLTALLGAVASVPKWSAAGALLAPGMLLAALVFPQGVHSNWGYTYLAIAGLLEAFILAWPVLWVWMAVDRWRNRR